MCFLLINVSSLTQFKELSKFTDSPDLILYVVHFSTRSTFHNPLQIFVDGIAPTRSWPSSKSMVFISFVSVFLTPSPVPGTYSRHSKYADELIHTGSSIRRHASWVHEGPPSCSERSLIPRRAISEFQNLSTNWNDDCKYYHEIQ